MAEIVLESALISYPGGLGLLNLLGIFELPVPVWSQWQLTTSLRDAGSFVQCNLFEMQMQGHPRSCNDS